MARVPSELRDCILAYWRGHSEAWKLSGLTQREYCAQQGIALKNFGNWRAQLKRTAIAGPKARWGHYPRLRPMANHMAGPECSHVASAPARAAKEPVRVEVSVPIPPPGARRQFSEEVKQRIVQETCRPGASVSAVARRYGIDLRLLFRWRRAFGVELPPAQTRFVTVEIRDDDGTAPDADLFEGAPS